MTTIKLGGTPINTVGTIPATGETVNNFTLTSNDLSEVRLSDFAGKRVVLNIFPSLDTGICAMSVRKFNQLAADLENTVVLCVSNDLPFAQARFCGAEGIDNVITVSGFRSSFGDDLGLTMKDGDLAGLLARAIIILDETGKVIYSKLNEEIKTEPDYDSAEKVLLG